MKDRILFALGIVALGLLIVFPVPSKAKAASKAQEAPLKPYDSGLYIRYAGSVVNFQAPPMTHADREAIKLGSEVLRTAKP